MFASKVVVSALLATVASAAAVVQPQPRQIGGIACNVARLRTVSALGNAGDAIGQIQDPDTASAAQAGLDQANGGIDEIASAILSGAQAPAEGRQAVEDGLTAMGTALSAGDAYVLVLPWRQVQFLNT